MTTLAASVPMRDAVTEKTRVSSIDIVRGLVMVIMAIDHIRDFFHFEAIAGQNPTDLQTTTPILFFTRWITHFCAPSFVMLAGTSIFISTKRKSKPELSKFLVSRGLWLIVLELIVIRTGIFFNLYYDVWLFQVIWAIGISMICMAGLIHLSYRTLLIIGLLILCGHNLLGMITIKPEDSFFIPWLFLYQSGFAPVTQTSFVMIPYPILPWLGVMLCGFCLGKIYTDYYSSIERQQLLLQIGLIAVVAFVVLRAINIYGDPVPWSSQKSFGYTVLSFLNTTKYPPSLLYLLMTLGPIIILLSALERVNTTSLKPLIVFGRVPMFYYIAHWYTLHTLAILAFLLTSGKPFSSLDFHFPKTFGGMVPNEAGYSLLTVYLVWICIVIALYPLCNWYNRYKSTHSNWWLSYL